MKAQEIENLISQMGAVWRYAVHVCEVRYAEELVQETYLQAFLAYAHAPDPDSARLYLFKILHSVVVNHHSHQSAPPAKQTSPVQPAEPAPPGSGGHSGLDRQLRMAICELPLSQRIVFLFSIVEQLRDQQIAEIVGISAEDVRVRLSEGHSAIAAKFPSRTFLLPPPGLEPR